MPYLVDIGGVLDGLGTQLPVSGTLDLDPVDLGEDHFEPVDPATFDVVLTNTGAGIVASGTVSAVYSTVCARCTRAHELDAQAEVDGFYVQHGDEEGVPEEQEIELIEDGRIDLAPALVQALIVELPFAPVCSQECKGLCPSCGADLNVSPCSCPRHEPDGPFAALKDLVAEPPDQTADS